MTDEPPLAAGAFSEWLSGIEAAIQGEADSDVPCAACTACCTSSQFIHISPDETETLAHIPRELRFPAPGMPAGHVLLGYDEHGHCPLFVENACSVYEHRPRTCRADDCRVFPATGITLDEKDQVLIARQARRWEFGVESERDRVARDAVGAAADFLARRSREFEPGDLPTTPTQLAALAIEIHELFLPDPATPTSPTVAEVRVAVTRRR